jgi:hypothetical protein
VKVIRNFHSPVSETIARQRALTFFTQAGYRQLPDCESCLKFKRGSVFGTISNFNPTQWACTANISIKSKANLSEINVETTITTDPLEKRFAVELMNEEFIRLEAAITTNEFNTFDIRYLKKRIASHVYRVVGLFAGLIILLVIGIIITWAIVYLH